MALINQNRSVVTMLAAMILTVFIVASAHAARGGNGGSKPGGGDPACTDEFPSFVFIKEGKGNTRSDEIMLSSGEGCRVVSLVTEDSGVRGGPAFKFDNNAGLVAWLDPAREVWFLRFTLDGSGNITAESPQFALAPVSPAEFFSAVDVWADYSMDPPTEYISLRSYLDYREMEPPEPGVDFEIRIIDLSACSGSGCSTATLISKNSVESLACMDGPFYPEGQSDCLIPEGTPAFNEAGDNIYYTTRTVKSENEQWLGTARLFQPTEGWFANEPVANELVAISTKWDCVDGAIPAGGRAAYVDA